MQFNMRKLAASLAAFALAAPGLAQAAVGDWVSMQSLDLLRRLAIGLGILFGGWLLASMARKGVYALLSRTDWDNRAARAIGLDLILPKGKDGKPASEGKGVETVLSQGVFYLLMLFVVMAAMDYAGLDATTGPISGFVGTVIGALPLIAKAALVLGAAWVAGTILRKVIQLSLGKLDLDRRFAQASGDEPPTEGRFAETAGSVAFWLVMFIGLAGAFEALKIDVVAAPLRDALAQVVELLPKLAIAAVIVLGGWILGRLARAVVQNLTQAFGVDRLPGRVGLAQAFERKALSDVLGLVVMVFVMAHAVIAALDRLGLETLSGPLTGTVNQFWTLLPALLVSALFLGVGLIVGRVVRQLVTSVLAGIGFDRWLASLGLDIKRLRSRDAEGAEGAEGAEEPAVAAAARIDEPSEIVGLIAQVVVVGVALVEVLRNLGLDAWSGIVQGFLAVTLVNVVLALAIVGVGFAVGNAVRGLILGRGPEGDSGKLWMGGAARMAVLVFAITMAVRQLDVASDFVLLTFGLLFGALCLALALAFGLGAREVAGEIVKERYAKRKQR